MYARNQYCNLFPLCRAISLFAMKAHVSIYRVGRRLAQCAPYATIHTALEAMAAAKRLSLQSNPLKVNYFVVLDNVQAYNRRYDPRIGVANAMLTGTGASAIVMQDCPPGAFDVEPYLALLAKGERKDLTVQKIYNAIDWTHVNAISSLHFVNILVHFVPALACYRQPIAKIFENEFAKHQINPTRKTQIHPLGTNSAKETSTKGMNEAVMDFAEQLGKVNEELDTKLHIFTGDGKSFGAIGALRRSFADQPSVGAAKLSMVEGLAGWHTKWTDLGRNCAGKWGDTKRPVDPSTLGFLSNVVRSPIPSDLKKPDFYPNANLLDTAVRAHVLRTWE